MKHTQDRAYKQMFNMYQGQYLYSSGTPSLEVTSSYQL